MSDSPVRRIPFGKPILGDEESQAIQAVLDTGMLVHGERIKEFESRFASFTGAPHAVGLASCTAALHLAYFHFGIGPGDEVIVPAQTHVATAHAVELAGACPVFVDADTETGNIDIDQVESAITARTRAISIVHFLGLPVDMKRLMAVARKHGLRVIEDCALALGATFQGTHVGLHGDVGCFSFYPVKHITTGEGGVLLTRDAEIAEGISKERAFGLDRHVGERKIPGEYDVTRLGFNYRMGEIAAAMGTCQLNRLDGFLEARRRNHVLLTERLSQLDGIELLTSDPPEAVSSCYCHCMLLADPLVAEREEIIIKLRAAGVGTSIYYPRPVPLFSYYREKYGCKDGEFPNAERISFQSIALPVGPHIGPEGIEYIAVRVAETLDEVR